MPIEKNLSDLPKVAYKDPDPVEGRMPDMHPKIGPKLMDAWYEHRTHDDNLPTAIPAAGPFRASWAGSCSRQIAYHLTKQEPTNPKTIADFWRLDTGSMVHERVQDAIPRAYPNAENERNVDLRPIGIRGSAHLDMLLPYKDGSGFAAVEIKSINGFGFKMSATSQSGPPEGPRTGAYIQGALAATALRAEGVNVKMLVVMYLSLELVSPKLAQKIGRGDELAKFEAEWSYEPEEFEPVAHAEAARWAEIDRLLSEDNADMTKADPVLVPREIPYVGLVVNPETATVQRDGKAFKTWQCDYCQYRALCTLDGPTPLPLDETY